MSMLKNECDKSGYGSIKLTVYQEWIDGMNRFFECWCRFKKTKSCDSGFRVGMIKNMLSHFVYETLKSAVS